MSGRTLLANGFVFVGSTIGFLGGALIAGVILWALTRYGSLAPFSVRERRVLIVVAVLGMAASFVVNPDGLAGLVS